MAENPPKVSVGLPVCNGEDYLRPALDCLVEQTFEDFELIISDNASTDTTPDICREYEARDSRVRYIRQARNQGIAANFNETFHLARGKYFKWAAHDDVCDRSFLAKAVDVLDRNEDVVLCASKTGLVDAAGSIMPASSSGDGSTDPVLPGLRYDVGPARLRFDDVLMNSNWGIEFFGLIRSEVLRATRLHRPYCLAEKVLLAELALRGRFYEIPELLLFMRHHDKQVSQTMSIREQSKMAAMPGTWRPALPFRMESSLGYFSVVFQAQLPLIERMRCLAVLMRYFTQIRKWKRVLHEALTGRPKTGHRLKQITSQS